MARTITSAFQIFRQNLEITDLQTSTVSTRQQSVRKAIEGELKVLDSYLTGSYSRHTLIAPLKEADIDIFLALAPEYYETNGQAKLLDRVRRALLKTYTKTPKISRNGQAVTITFTDFVVDVVPGFYREGGGYLIADTQNMKWIPTDPKAHVDFLSAANAAHASALVPTVKMIKRWNRVINRAFRSFYLELLVERILRGVRIDSYPSAARYVFDKGRELIEYTITDPAGLGTEVEGFDSVATRAEAIDRFETAHAHAYKAEQFAQVGRPAVAIAEWQKIFGNYFPAYG